MKYLFITIVVVATLVILFSFDKVKKAILSLFGGSIELPEFAGVVFLGLFSYMIWKEGEREHQWHIYNELYILFTAGAAMTGLGLGRVLDTIKSIKGGSQQQPKQDPPAAG